jgi:cytochrome c biogenesis protein
MTGVKSKWLPRIGSMKLGIVLLALIALAVVAGTVILQKPMADPGQIEKVYSPSKLKVYEALGLLDLFHSRWFTALLALLMVNIAAASILRFPVVWREIRRHRPPDEALMRAMPNHETAPAGLAQVANALRRRHYGVRTLPTADGRAGLTADRQRYARLAPYFVHFSLLVILSGGVIDSLFGYRAFMRLRQGEQKSTALRMLTDEPVRLPFAVRCDAAGMEQYPDGSPKRYWSKLAVVEDGRQVARKEIEVNSPLVHRGLRFFQSSYGRSGDMQLARLSVLPKSREETAAGRGDSPHGNVTAAPGKTAAGPATSVLVSAQGETEIPEYGLRVRVTAFYPDFVINGSEIASRSEELNNPAMKLAVTRGEETIPVWVFANYPQFSNTQELPVRFEFSAEDIELGYFTGLQVSRQPGQWLVWLGSTILAFGLIWAFAFSHRQYWAIELPKTGAGASCLVAGMATKNQDEFREEFGELTESLKQN